MAGRGDCPVSCCSKLRAKVRWCRTKVSFGHFEVRDGRGAHRRLNDLDFGGEKELCFEKCLKLFLRNSSSSGKGGKLSLKNWRHEFKAFFFKRISKFCWSEGRLMGSLEFDWVYSKKSQKQFLNFNWNLILLPFSWIKTIYGGWGGSEMG